MCGEDICAVRIYVRWGDMCGEDICVVGIYVR